MDRKKAGLAALALAVVGVVGYVAIINRYEITVGSNAVIRFDRWTGRLEGCSASGCVPLENSNRKLTINDLIPVEPPPPPPVDIELFDGTRLQFPPGSEKANIQTAIARITKCKKSAQSWDASNTCARAPVEDQISGHGYLVVKNGGWDYEAEAKKSQRAADRAVQAAVKTARDSETISSDATP